MRGKPFSGTGNPAWPATRKLSTNGLMGSSGRGTQVLTRLKSLSPNHRFMIALLSPDGVFETGLPMGPSEKRATKLAWGVKYDAFYSPVCRQDLRNCGHFERFFGDCSEVSLQSRLRGGAEWIRTLGTGLNDARGDVCVSCTESISSEILRRLAAPQSPR